MKVQSPKISKELPEICDYIGILKEARENESQIEGISAKSICMVGENIAGQRFSNVLFENVRFTDCNFQKCSFIDVIFKNCDLSNCNMSQGYFNRCQFITNKAVGIKLNEAIMRDVTIIECNLEYANLTGANMKEVELLKANFNNAYFMECKLKNVICENVEFLNTNFFKTSLKGIDFTKSTVTNIVVSSEGTELKGAIMDLYQAAEIARMLGIIIK